jgi:hypothetical protein
VFALNLLNWVEDKTRLLAVLGRFEELIFEGHDSTRARFLHDRAGCDRRARPSRSGSA